MYVNLTEREAIMLVGLLGATSGNGLCELYAELKHQLIFHTLNGENAVELSNSFATVLSEKLQEVIIDEDDLLEEAWEEYYFGG